MTDSTTGHRLKLLMKQGGVTNVALAQAVRVSKETVAYWRNNTQGLSATNANAVVEYLRARGVVTSIGYLLHGEASSSLVGEGTVREVDDLLNDVDHFVNRYRLKEAEGAPDDVLRRIYEQAAAAARGALQATGGDPDLTARGANHMIQLMLYAGRQWPDRHAKAPEKLAAKSAKKRL